VKGFPEIGFVVAILCAAASQVAGQGPSASASNPVLSIRLYDSAGVPRRTIDSAEKVAAQILAACGVAVS
jgi:hypothetical protein